MTPEEHFEKASEHLVEANSTNNTARFWAQMRVSEHHTALGRAKSEHEARKDFAAERARATIPPYTPIPAARARDLMAQMQPGHTLAWDHDIKALNETINTVTEARDRALVAKAELAGKVDDLSAACAQKDQEITNLNTKVKNRDLAIEGLSDQVRTVSKQWAERGGRILTLEQEIKALKDKLDTGNFVPAKLANVIYGACRPAAQVWRTPETTRWRGSRSGWEIECDVETGPAVYVRSVDYPGTNEVGVDLVMRPKDAAEGEMVGHDRLVLLQRQVMTEEAWRNSEFEYDGFDRLVLLQRQVMTEEAWRNSEFEYDGFDRD